ncbi:MAG: amidohydrolase [Vulcanimicrobiota bacterium]
MSALFKNGWIWDGSSQFVWGDLCVREGVFTQPAWGRDAVDLEGGYVLPALWDSHLHLLLLARALGQLDLTGCRHKGDLLELLADGQGAWVEGYGWNESHWEDPQLPSLEELDRACRGRPCWLTRSDLHSGMTNLGGLRMAQIQPGDPDPFGGRIERDASGRLTGILADQAMQLVERVLSPLELPRLKDLLRQACSRLHGYGISGVCDQRLPDADDGPLAWEVYRELRLPLRIHCNRSAHEDLSEGPRFLEGDDWLRGGHVKFFADGSLGSRTARMLEAYQGSQERGLWITEPVQLREGFARAHAHGFPVSVHAIGDEAVRTVCQLLPKHPLDRVEHLQILHQSDLELLGPGGPVASMQPLHLLDDRSQAEQLLGERSRGYYRLASLDRQGVRLSFGSDAPVASFDPWLGIQAACLRQRSDLDQSWFPEERLGRAAALRAYTRGACLSLGWEKSGSLAVGCLGDFCVVDRNPLECPWPSQVRVLRTVIGGKTHFSL